jgi:hypothetical protein
MQAIATICLDIAKPFQVHDVDAEGKVTLRRQLKRRCVLAFFQKLPRCLVLLSQKVAREARTDSCKGRDSDISRWGLIWISERQTTVNRDLRGMSRGL